ncbi:MAG: hypothetical protein AAFV43_10050 [Planctomycetota bacterium]
MREVSKWERVVAEEANRLLAMTSAGVIDLDQASIQTFMSALEHFVPEVLAEISAAWVDTALDDVSPTMMDHTSDHRLRFDGHCLTMSLQELPLSALIKPRDDGEHLDHFECFVGAAGRNASDDPLFAHAEFGSSE